LNFFLHIFTIKFVIHSKYIMIKVSLKQASINNINKSEYLFENKKKHLKMLSQIKTLYYNEANSIILGKGNSI